MAAERRTFDVSVFPDLVVIYHVGMRRYWRDFDSLERTRAGIGGEADVKPALAEEEL